VASSEAISDAAILSHLFDEKRLQLRDHVLHRGRATHFCVDSSKCLTGKSEGGVVSAPGRVRGVIFRGAREASMGAVGDHVLHRGRATHIGVDSSKCLTGKE
jgi:hypothetical protein